MDIYSLDKVLVELGVSYGDSVLVACSGGADSISLLHTLLNSRLELKCKVAHVNFHLRDNFSNEDEQFVREWCLNYGVELFVNSVDTYSYAKEKNLSIEMAAREIRYNWFSEIIKKESIKHLAVAHHADDNAETLLLNLTRGTGLKGLCAIPKRNGNIIRPLLGFTRSEIEKYMLYHRLDYRTDHTNLESDYSRNKIRNIVFPQLKKINPSLIPTLNRNIEYFSMANEIIEQMLPSMHSKIVVDKGNFAVERFSINNLLELQQWQYWLFLLLQKYGFNSAQSADISAILREPTNGAKRVESSSYVVVIERGLINVYPIELTKSLLPINILTEGIYNFGEYKIELELSELSSELFSTIISINDHAESSNSLYLNASNIEFPIKLRPFEKGDKFTPYRMRGKKKISDLFTDIKLEHIMRNRVPLLVDSAGEILCVPGVRIADRYKLDKSSSKVLTVKRTNA